MSTSTTNYGFTKPEPLDPSGEESVAANIILSDKVLQRIDGGTNPGLDNKHLFAWHRTTAATGLTKKQEGDTPDVWTWNRIGLSASMTNLYEVDQGAAGTGYGISYSDDWGYFEFYTPGFWRINWNVRVQTSATAFTEGMVRAAILNYSSTDDATYSKAIKQTSMAKTLDTFAGFTDIGGDHLIKVTLQDDDSGDLKVSGTSNLYPFSGAPYYGLYLAVAHNCTDTSTINITNTGNTYFHAEWVRGL